MTAKEKVRELIDKFSDYSFDTDAGGSYCERVERKNAVGCAKIAVQEILKLDVLWVNAYWSQVRKRYLPAETKEFWEEVMEELNK